MTAEDVNRIILSPMQAAYPAPHHLRGDPEARQEALAVYLRALERFDHRTLERAWGKVTSEHTFWTWPVPGKIAEACRLFAPRSPEPESEDARRRRQAAGMSEAYTGHYMKTSRLARLARQEGWAGHLRYYVAAASWVQAQFICGVEGVSWEADYLTKPGQFLSSAEALADYRRRIDGPVSRGEVLVRVPPSRVREWKAAAQAPREPSLPPCPGDEHRPQSGGHGRG